MARLAERVVSAARRKKSATFPEVAESAVNVLFRQATALHRAVLSLCEKGWGATAPILCRTMQDFQIGMLMIMTEDHDYRGFQYLAFDYLKWMHDTDMSAWEQVGLLSALKEWLDRLASPMDRQRALKFLEVGGSQPNWYSEHYGSAKKAIVDLETKYAARKGFALGQDYESPDIWLWKRGSSHVHGGMLGIPAYGPRRSQPIEPGTATPDYDLNAVTVPMFLSCRHLLNMCLIRNEIEKLELDEECKKLWLQWKESRHFRSRDRAATGDVIP